MLLIDLVALMGLIALMGHAFIAVNMCHLDDQAEHLYTLDECISTTLSVQGRPPGRVHNSENVEILGCQKSRS